MIRIFFPSSLERRLDLVEVGFGQDSMKLRELSQVVIDLLDMTRDR